MVKICYFYLLFLLFITINTQENIQELREDLANTCQNKEIKVNTKLTMSYFTPWGQGGQDLTLKFINKLDIITPCWFEIKPEILHGKFNSMIDGSNYVNTQFLKDVKAKNPNAKILPRFHCQNFNLDSIGLFLAPENRGHFFKVLIRRLKYNKYHGMVLDCTTLWMIDSLYTKTADFFRELYEALKKENMLLVTVMFPYADSFQNIISRDRFKYIAKYTDYFNIMTYDYLQYANTKEIKVDKYNISPLPWIEKTINYYVEPNKPESDKLLSKIILGLPFHGLLLEQSGPSDPKGQELTTELYQSIVTALKDNSDLQWDKETKEHTIEFSNQGKTMIALYPTKKFLRERINYAIKTGLAGVSIWELTKGLESFLDEF